MKNINILNIALLVVGLCLSSCDDFLDQEPQDSVSEAVYFTTAAQFENASNYFYTRLHWDNGVEGTDQVNSTSFDAGSDLSNNIGYGSTREYGQGYTIAPTDDDIWGDNYYNLRAVNQLLEKAVDYPGEQSEIEASLGTAYFFRAWHHYLLLMRFGGVTIVTSSLTEESPEVTGARNSRYEVAAQIFSDLDDAIAMLPSQNDYTDADQGKISLEAAQALKARLLLFEATWEMNIGTETDGDGTSTGAGSTKPDGYPSTTEMLTEAKEMASSIMNSGAFELWDKRETLGDRHLFYLFTLEDGGDNPAGFTKADNKEFILQSVFDYTYRQTGKNMSHSMATTPSRKMMDMMLCTDGLPIQHSPLFNGYMDMTDEYQNRDLRMASFFSQPLEYYWGYGGTGRGGGAIYDENIEDQDYDFRYIPILNAPSNGRSFGYEGHKYVTEYKLRESTEESMNYPHIRYAEVLLTYAEAIVELDGDISDADLDLSINLIRERSGVAPLSAALIAPYSDLTMRGEIRRERGVELFGEGLRFQDLKRWGIAEEELNRNICTNYIQYDGTSTEYETFINPKDTTKAIYDASVWADGLTTGEETPYNYEGIASTKAGALIIDPASNRIWTKTNYLDPIPKSQIDLNSNLLQNPGW